MDNTFNKIKMKSLIAFLKKFSALMENVSLLWP